MSFYLKEPHEMEIVEFRAESWDDLFDVPMKREMNKYDIWQSTAVDSLIDFANYWGFSKIARQLELKKQRCALLNEDGDRYFAIGVYGETEFYDPDNYEETVTTND